jgi:pyruvate/2-oxoglutarate/acetoin dehydrogenase E1 component
MPLLTYAQALNEALHEEMQSDPRVFVMGEDIGLHGGMFRVTQGLLDEFGAERVIETPISEAAFVGLGVGAAMSGMHPVAN